MCTKNGDAKYSLTDIIAFVMWYCGTSEKEVLKAWNKYISEIRGNHK